VQRELEVRQQSDQIAHPTLVLPWAPALFVVSSTFALYMRQWNTYEGFGLLTRRLRLLPSITAQMYRPQVAAILVLRAECFGAICDLPFPRILVYASPRIAFYPTIL
jgi:hypothetical protein